MSYHGSRIQLARGHHLKCLFHIIGIAAACSHDMSKSIMNIIKIEFGTEASVRWPGKKVQAAVKSKYPVAGFHRQA
jgi:hypothetical protein